jgi:hypothetical protein
MRMLGYEPPQPKLWKAVLGAAIITTERTQAKNIN